MFTDLHCVVSGGNRYIPPGSSGRPEPAHVADPFTGASRYVPSYGNGVPDSPAGAWPYILWKHLIQSIAALCSLHFCVSMLRHIFPF